MTLLPPNAWASLRSDDHTACHGGTHGRVLGLPEYEFAIIDHPVSATDAAAEFTRTAMTQGEGLLLQKLKPIE